MINNKEIVVYPVILHLEDVGYSVEVPDLNVWTQGENLKDALLMAQDVIGITLEDKSQYPDSSEIGKIKVKDEDLKTFVTVNLVEYRRNNPKTVRKNVSVPEYLVKLGKEQNINFSATLTEALMNKLKV